MVDKIVPFVKDFLIGFIAGCFEVWLLKDDKYIASLTEEEILKALALPDIEPVDRDEAASALARGEFSTW